MRTILRFVFALALLVTPLAAHAVPPYWTAVGFSGVLGITGLNLAGYNGAGLTYNASAGTTSFGAIYNVTSSQIKPVWTNLVIGYSGTTSPGSNVVGTLYQVDPATGLTTVICSVGSNAVDNIEGCSFPSTSFDFSSHSYYVAVVLSRTSTSQHPQINHVSIN
jgi:hypothetical protein